MPNALPHPETETPVPVLIPTTADQAEELLLALEWIWRMQPPSSATAGERAAIDARRQRVDGLYARVGLLLVQYRGWSPREWRIDADRARVGATLAVLTDPAPRPVIIPLEHARITRRGERLAIPMTATEARDLLRGLQFRTKQRGLAPTVTRSWSQHWQEIVEFGADVAAACERAFGWAPGTWADLLADPITTKVVVPRATPRRVVR